MVDERMQLQMQVIYLEQINHTTDLLLFNNYIRIMTIFPFQFDLDLMRVSEHQENPFPALLLWLIYCGAVFTAGNVTWICE